MPVSSFCEYIFNLGRKINKINIGRRNANSQWLIPFKKIWLFKLSLQRGGNFNNLIIMML